MTAVEASPVAATAGALSVGLSWTRGVTTAGEEAPTVTFAAGFNESTFTPEETCCGAYVRGFGVSSSFFAFFLSTSWALLALELLPFALLFDTKLGEVVFLPLFALRLAAGAPACAAEAALFFVSAGFACAETIAVGTLP